MARHDRITRVLTMDAMDTEGERITPILTDEATGVSTALAGEDECIEFTGHAGGVGAIRTTNGWAVLHHAVNANDEALLRRVLGFELDVDVPDGKGWTPVHHAAWVGNGALVRVLREHGAALDLFSNKDRLSPLQVSIVVDTVNAAEALLALGADPELALRDDLRPLHLAAMQGRAAIARLLLAHGVSMDAPEINGSTALHAAAFTGHEDVVRALLAAGANPGIVDAHGNTPRSLALTRNHAAIVALLPADPGNGDPDPDHDDDASDLVEEDDEDERVAVEQLLQQLDEIARTGQPIFSKSQGEHFANIVPVMNLVGATRQGSQAVRGSDGKSYILDLYTLPGGLELKAGYPD